MDASANVRAENVVPRTGGCVRLRAVNGSVSRAFDHAQPAGDAQRAQCAGGDCRGDRSRRSDAAIIKALAEFKGVGRRFPALRRSGAAGRRQLHAVDDYGHHPAEMKATIAAGAALSRTRRLLLAFQPHRYTRTRDCFEDFVSVLNTVDALVLAEVYAAARRRSSPPTGARWRARLRVAGKVEPVFVENIADVPQTVLDVARDGDVVITMGAGSIGGVPGKLVKV